MFIALCTTGFSSLRLERHVLVFHQNMTLSHSLDALEAIGFLVRVISCEFVDRLIRSEKSDPRNHTK